MTDKNLIPSVHSEGSFTAEYPFDNICNPDTYFTAEAIRTVEEMREMKLNLQTLIFDPIGLSVSDGNAILEETIRLNGAIVKLSSRDSAPIYIPSNKFLSFPMVDGVKYEHLAFIVDLGPCPPSLKASLEEGRQYISEYIQTKIGITNPTVMIGNCPVNGYTSADQAEIFENTRLSRINQTSNTVTELAELKATVLEQKAYIESLENIIKENSL